MNKGAEHIEYPDLIVKSLSGQLMPQEQHQLDLWLQSDVANQRLYEEYEQVWNDMDKVKGRTSQDVDREWQRLAKVIDADLAPSGQGSHHSSIFMRMAAAFVVLLSLAAGVYYLLKTDRVVTVASTAQMEVITLPEGSVISLNNHTELRYDKNLIVISARFPWSGRHFLTWRAIRCGHLSLNRAIFLLRYWVLPLM